MSNIIYNDNNGDMIGYVQDIVKELKDAITDYVKVDNWEEVKELCDLLLDLNGYADNSNLLVVSSSDRMGYTIKEYQKGEE